MNQKVLYAILVIVGLPLIVWANVYFYGWLSNKDEVEALQKKVTKLEQRIDKLEKNTAIQAGTSLGNIFNELSNGNN